MHFPRRIAAVLFHAKQEDCCAPRCLGRDLPFWDRGANQLQLSRWMIFPPESMRSARSPHEAGLGKQGHRFTRAAKWACLDRARGDGCGIFHIFPDPYLASKFMDCWVAFRIPKATTYFHRFPLRHTSIELPAVHLSGEGLL